MHPVGAKRFIIVYLSKWETGQSFPNIQNLILLSEIFKIPIDRLVKNNDTCNISIFSDYYGHILNSNFSVDFLKETLSLVSLENPYRGIEFYQKGAYTYHCQVNGDFECCHGEESIYCKQDKVYFCIFHGGDIS